MTGIERQAMLKILDRLAEVASEWEPMLHVEEISVGENYGSNVNLSLWIWIQVEGKKLVDAMNDGES